MRVGNTTNSFIRWTLNYIRRNKSRNAAKLISETKSCKKIKIRKLLNLGRSGGSEMPCARLVKGGGRKKKKEQRKGNGKANNLTKGPCW